MAAPSFSFVFGQSSLRAEPAATTLFRPAAALGLAVGSRTGTMRYRGGLFFLLCIAALPAAAADHLKLGLVKVANSGGTYIAVEKGYFTAEGIDPEIVFFEGGGVPIAV